MPGGRILYGRIGEENPRHPGTYEFISSDGYRIPDAIVMTPDSDVAGNGSHSKPEVGSLCVAVMTNDGAGCFILGFHRPPKFNEASDDIPVIGDAEGNNIGGDKIWRTSGGASFCLKRGGAVVLEGGPRTVIILNPINDTMSLRAANVVQSADGYRASRGREEPGATRPATVHHEDFLHQVGSQADRVRISHGNLEDGARRRLELASVTTVSSQETGVTKTRESYMDDGSWVGEGPKYQWGGSDSDEPAVLGNQLVEALSTLIDTIASLKVNTAWGPSTPPLPDTQSKLTQLKAELKDKILSTFLFLSKKPPTLL